MSDISPGQGRAEFNKPETWPNSGFNERVDKQISVRVDGQVVVTGLTKFGALIGDGSRIGANAVTSPGTLLPPGSVVPRLGLVDQLGAGGDR